MTPSMFGEAICGNGDREPLGPHAWARSWWSRWALPARSAWQDSLCSCSDP